MSAQRWDAADYAANARFVSDLGQPVLDLLQPQPGERILDIGCGDGALTERIAASGAQVVGIDASPELTAAARARGLDVRLLDARALSFEHEFDAVFTNAVLHWIPELDVVLANVHRALRPGGRFVGEFGGHGCVAAVCTAIRAVARNHRLDVTLPWRYPTDDEFASLLSAAGFEPEMVRLVPRPTFLPSGMDAWLRTFAVTVFAPLDEGRREEALRETVELLRPSLCDAQGRWTADYMRLRFVAHRR
jgi:SAM-dependent methyltransferase